MTTAGLSRPRSSAALWVIVAAGIAVMTLAASARVGPVALALPPAIAAGALLLRRPDVALGLLLAFAVIAEADEESFMPTSRLFEPIVPGLQPFDLLYLAVAAIVAVDCVRRRSAPALVGFVAVPLALLVTGMAWGAVTGYFAGADRTRLLGTLLVLAYLVVTPMLVVAVIHTRHQFRFLVGAAAVLVALKAVTGVMAAVVGLGPEEANGTHITYYESTPNWLLVLLLAIIAAGVLRRARLPAWTIALWPLAALALALSYRRAFWIMAALSLLAVVVLGATRLQRRFAVPVALLVAGGIALLVNSGAGAGFQGPVVDRAKSLSPTEISASRDDRYRISERQNVVEEIRRHPIAGLGIGVPWAARHPLPKTGSSDSRQYNHMAVLWFWLKLGILGPLAYLSLLVGGAVAGYRVFRRHPDPLASVLGLASCACLLALVAGELTASFTGVDGRFTVILGAQFGLLSLLYREARETTEPAAAPA